MAYNSIEDISKILSKYANTIQDQITEAADEISEEGKNKLKNTTGTYKIRTGKYNKGWKVRKSKGDRYVNNTIYNSTQYRLTHLLENGHANRDGSRTRAFVHIAPVENYCVSTFEEKVEEIIKKGGVK